MLNPVFPAVFSLASPRHCEAFGRSTWKSRMSGTWLSAWMNPDPVRGSKCLVYGFGIQFWGCLRIEKSTLEMMRLQIDHEVSWVWLIASENMIFGWIWGLGVEKASSTCGAIRSTRGWRLRRFFSRASSPPLKTKHPGIVPALDKTPCHPWRI